jgi:hypothetical protein
MTVEWANLDQPKFDRIVEALVRHRFGEKVRAVNGRGGDDGIDIEITFDDARLWILQLKFFPEGFSSVWGKRRTDIRDSFQTARKHAPAEWTLVVPCLCTNAEHKYVVNLNGGRVPPKITVIDRDDLDAWMADAPSIDAYVQRTATSELREMARDFNQERAALLGGIPDVVSRVRNLGNVVDAVDPDWAVDFARSGDTTEVVIRARDPDAPVRSPIGFTVEIGELGDEHAELQQQLMRNIGYATSERLRIPRDVVRSVRFHGPEFIAGDYPPGAVEIVSGSRGPAVGQLLEFRAFHEGSLTATYEGRITHAAPGPIGGSIEATFCGGHLNARLRLPHEADSAEDSHEFLRPGIDLELDYGVVPPSVVEQVLSTRRVLRYATRLEARINGDLLVALRPSDASEADMDYEADLLAIEQFAYDLDVVQRHTGQFFDIPEYMLPGDRVKMRVARLLIEGYIVASPRAPRFTLTMIGIDTPEVRDSLPGPRSIVWPAGPYAVTIGGRELIIGDVYAVHPAATAINADEAIAALDAGEVEGFEVDFRPGNDPFFYLTFADIPAREVMRRSLAQWTLSGVDQPGVPDADWSPQSK